MNKRLLLSAISILALAGHQRIDAETQQKSHVSGRVYDSENKPLPGATVSIFPFQTAWEGPMPAATTDVNGFYSLYLPPIGKTRIFAAKESAGYPGTFYSLFSSGTENDPIKEITAGSEYNNVDIHLGMPDGTVDITILNKKTGTPIHTAHVLFRRTDDSTIYFSTGARDGEYVTPLPRKPISIEITAAGFHPWQYFSTNPSIGYIELESFERKSIRAELEPFPDSDK